ncbi:type II toxin-antitoxin system PemK/MazF family toxin [Microbacterium sp. LS_15]|uniref:type II toxin-antitoxin system PemK/MazF family toxin n=1 Tax=Microbacterium sp. LS_15 TaxID=3055790 RepID=UPI0035C04012
MTAATSTPDGRRPLRPRGLVEGPSGLDRPSWIMTEQPRTVSRERLTGIAGSVSPGCLAEVRLARRRPRPLTPGQALLGGPNSSSPCSCSRR